MLVGSGFEAIFPIFIKSWFRVRKRMCIHVTPWARALLPLPHTTQKQEKVSEAAERHPGSYI